MQLFELERAKCRCNE